MLCCGYTLTDCPISTRLTSLALWQSNDCPSAGKATLMNMDKYFMWNHYERLHNHNKAKHNKTVCIFIGIYCTSSWFIDTKADFVLQRKWQKIDGITEYKWIMQGGSCQAGFCCGSVSADFIHVIQADMEHGTIIWSLRCQWSSPRKKTNRHSSYSTKAGWESKPKQHMKSDIYSMGNTAGGVMQW